MQSTVVNAVNRSMPMIELAIHGHRMAREVRDTQTVAAIAFLLVHELCLNNTPSVYRRVYFHFFGESTFLTLTIFISMNTNFYATKLILLDS